MPTVMTHAALGWGLARAARRRQPDPLARPRAVMAAALAVAPDLDVVAFRLGIPHDHMLGHRGLSHSLAFAALAALACWAGLRRWSDGERSPGPVDLAVLFAAAASHALLDMATNGGLGVALLAPFSTDRFFWPARPIPVSPIGVGAS